MKLSVKSLLFCLALTLLAVPVMAQGVFGGQDTDRSNRGSSRRLEDTAQQLSRDAETLFTNTYSDYANRSNNYGNNANRTDLDSLFLAQQFNASADLFYRMVRDRRPSTELRQAYNILQDLYRRGNSSVFRNQWSQIQTSLNNVSNELNNYGGGRGGNYGGGRGGNYGGGYRSGVLTWRGTVDDRVQLVIRDDYIEQRTLGGSEYNSPTYNFTTPLPRSQVNLTLNKRRGRGDVRIVEQPSQYNNWTATIEIRDSKGGADDYEFELRW